MTKFSDLKDGIVKAVANRKVNSITEFVKATLVLRDFEDFGDLKTTWDLLYNLKDQLATHNQVAKGQASNSMKDFSKMAQLLSLARAHVCELNGQNGILLKNCNAGLRDIVAQFEKLVNIFPELSLESADDFYKKMKAVFHDSLSLHNLVNGCEKITSKSDNNRMTAKFIAIKIKNYVKT